MADKVTIQVDLTEFNQAMREYVAASKMTVAEAVNKKAADLCFYAADNTDVAPQQRMRALPMGLFHALAAAKPGGKGSANFHAAAEAAQERISKKLGSGPFVKGKKNEQAARAIKNLRVRASNYSRAIWYKLAAQIKAQTSAEIKGKRGPAKQNKIKNTSAKAAQESGFTDKPYAVLDITGITEDHSRDVMEKALRRAIPELVADMRTYINRKLSGIASDYSGKGKRSRSTGAPRGRRRRT